MVPEDRQQEGLLPPMSLSENATLANLRRISNRGWLRPKLERERTKVALDRLRTSYRDPMQPAAQLSGGNQQKVVIAKWLMTDPTILILDEPTRGVDVGAKQEIHRLIREMAEGGMAILMVTGDLPELLALSDRILIMRNGAIVGELEGRTATEDQVMALATGQEGA
jgi:rhamnose transport system ATP-binding protein